MPEIEHGTKHALFGKYELGKLLGCGAFAKVYHAIDLRNGDSVAVKVINKNRVSSTNLMDSIKREISIMRKLHHQHIVNLHEVLATKSKVYFVMDLIRGGELFTVVNKGRFSEDLSRKYFHQLISAVAYCHSRGVFHRDLKPENILIDENGNLKVSDFGLSALTNQIESDGLLHTLCGTPAYVAPEILAKKGYDGAKVDIWSCGVILFVLSAGYLPFNDPNLMSMYRKIYNGMYRCPKGMSHDLKRFLSRLLETNPEKRITIHEMIKDPWFKKGGLKDMKFHNDENNALNHKDEPNSITDLNAFDLISFSSGLNLSGLFDVSSKSMDDGERFVSGESPEKLIGMVEEFGKANRLRVKKKEEYGVELEGRNGNLLMGVIVHRLTEELVIVEAKKRDGDTDCFSDVWNNRLKPHLLASTGNGGCR